MDTVAKSFDPFLEQKAETSAIALIEESGLTAVAAQDDVIQCPRIVEPRLASHGATLHNKLRLCNPAPQASLIMSQRSLFNDASCNISYEAIRFL